jgi:hypothetical protein
LGCADSGEDLTTQQSEAFLVHPWVGVIGSDELGHAFDCGPPPPRSYHDRNCGVGAQKVELATPACGHERHHAGVLERMGHNAGIYHGGLGGVVGAAGDDDAETVVEGNEPF